MSSASLRRGAARSARVVVRRGSPRRMSSMVELREDRLHPGAASEWAAAFQSSAVRSSQLRTATLPEVGGVLDVATTTYSWSGHEERSAYYAALAADPLDHSGGRWVAERKSCLYVEPPLVADFGLHGLANAAPPEGASGGGGDAIYELRRYQLQLGYKTVPRFLELYAGGLPSKLAAPGTDPSSSLVTVLNTEVGSLNEVIELWRHGRGTVAMDQSRQAARGAAPWREAIGSIAALAVSFTTSIHRPLPSAPWQ